MTKLQAKINCQSTFITVMVKIETHACVNHHFNSNNHLNLLFPENTLFYFVLSPAIPFLILFIYSFLNSIFHYTY